MKKIKLFTIISSLCMLGSIYAQDETVNGNLSVTGTSTFNDNMTINGTLGQSILKGAQLTLDGTPQNNNYPIFWLRNPVGAWKMQMNPDASFSFTDVSTNNGVFKILEGASANSFVVYQNRTEFNASGLDRDFKIEGVSQPNAFFVEGSSGNIGIGTSSPDSPIHINQSGPEALRFDRSGHNSYKLYLGGTKGLYFKNFTDNRDELVFDGNGNIGIGTSSPARKLEALGAIRSTRSNNTNQYVEMETGEANYGRIKSNSASNNQKGLAIQNIVGDTSNPVNSNNYIDFRNGTGAGALRYRIDYLGNHNFQSGDISTSGNVRIGSTTSNPNAKLHIKGEEYLESGNINFITSSSDASGTTGIKANPNGWTRLDPNGSRFLMPVTGSDVSAKRNILDIENTNDNWNRLMSLKADGSGFFMGSVGVGANTTHNSRFRVLSNTADVFMIGREGFNNWTFRNTHGGLGIDNGSLIIKPHISQGINASFAVKTSLSDSGNPDFLVDKQGNIGVGMSNPSEKLDVDGKIKSKEDIFWGTSGASLSVNQGASIELRGNGVPFIDFTNDTNTDYDVRLILENDNHLTVSGGSVGIGTNTTGNHKLAVEGSIGAREIKVEASGWSDFVFYKDYHLPTLAEVEQHIKEKGHLKDIPSAEEVEKNGIFLGDMNAKLLQKIEELTLYTIQQEKEIKELTKLKNELDKEKKRNNALEKRLKKIEVFLNNN